MELERDLIPEEPASCLLHHKETFSVCLIRMGASLPLMHSVSLNAYFLPQSKRIDKHPGQLSRIQESFWKDTDFYLDIGSAAVIGTKVLVA